jgi:RNA polymerase sigma-32 factor
MAVDEYRLVRRWQSHHDKAALDVLVRAQMPHVIALARRYQKYSPITAFDDLVGAGAEGLLIGINKFDPNRGVRLITYTSHWVKALMFERVREDWRHGKTKHPGNRSAVFWRLRRDRARLHAQGYPNEQIVPLIAKATGIPEGGIRAIFMAFDTGEVSLDAPQVVLRDKAWVDVLVDSGPSPYDLAAQSEDAQVSRATVEKALARLDPRERFVIEQRYLHRGHEQQPTLSAIGQKLGLSRERVRQLEARAFKKMRRMFGVSSQVSPQVAVHVPVRPKSVRASSAQPSKPLASAPTSPKFKLNKLLARMKRKSAYTIR